MLNQPQQPVKAPRDHLHTVYNVTYATQLPKWDRQLCMADAIKCQKHVSLSVAISTDDGMSKISSPLAISTQAVHAHPHCNLSLVVQH